jgi:D-amino-acid oxidase
MPAPHVAVVGAGVIGLTTAIELREAGMRVTIHASEIPGQTSLAAGASWGPYLVRPYDRVSSWGDHTLSVLSDLTGTAGSGVRLVTGVEASRTATEIPLWAKMLPNVRECRPHELPEGFVLGWRYAVPVVDMPRYLGMLLNRFQASGGVIRQGHIERLASSAPGADVIVNCAGLGAAELADDRSLFPIRGQLVVVRNPGISEFFSEDTGESSELLHYLPHGDSMILGGIATAYDYRRDADDATAAAILARCAHVEPRLQGVTVLEHRVGLRPTRPEIRLDVEQIGNVTVVHNYGHGGAGVSLSWGCAAEVKDLVRRLVGEAD